VEVEHFLSEEPINLTNALKFWAKVWLPAHSCDCSD